MRNMFLIIATMLSAACNNRQAVQCEQTSDCNLSGGGVCTASSSGMWCAYPDPECPSGYRYSNQDIGDGLAGTCVPSGGSDGGIRDGKDGPPPDGSHVVPGSWSKQIPGAGFESIDGIAVGADGSVYVVGSFDGTLDLGQPVTAGGANDVFVTKFTSAGDHVWTRHYGGSSTSTDYAGGSNNGGGRIKVLSNGDLVIAGGFQGSLTLGTNTFTSSGDLDVYVARLSNTGDVLWSAHGGSSGHDTVGDIEVDTSDNIAMCGGKGSGGTFFGTGLSGGYNPWIARMTGAGSPSWVKALTGSIGNPNCGVAMMSNGDVVIAGAFNGTMNAGGSTLTSTSNSLDLFLARFTGDTGSHVWSASKGGTADDVAYDVAASGSTLVVTGYFDNYPAGATTSYGGNTFTAVGEDAFVAAFDASNGNHQFSVQLGGTMDQAGQHLSIRSDGQIAVTGLFDGTANFGGTQLTSNNGSFDPFLIEMDGNGAVTSVKSAGGPSRDESHDVVSTDDSLIFGGTFSSSITVFNQTFTSLGGLDGYIVRYKR